MAFGDSQIGNLVAVGTIEPRSVRLWARAERPGRFVLTMRQGLDTLAAVQFSIAPGNLRDNTLAVQYPEDFPGAPPLRPADRYTFKVESAEGDLFVGAGEFETAPADAAATPDRFSIGVLSCHQPFSSEGAVSPRNMRLLQALPAMYQRYDIKLLIAAGDQIYADAPDEFSLTAPYYVQSRWPDRGPIHTWSRQQVREAYQERYRICWDQEPWRKLLASFPNYAILDDHEVFDDWGVKPEHAREPYRTVIEGARLAYLDYQGSRQLPWSDGAAAPAALDYRFAYGSVAGFVFDLRSERQAGPPSQVVSPQQLGRFERFLADSRSAQVVLVVTSVPLVHIPEWLTAAGQFLFGSTVDFPDHWSAPANREQRKAIVRLIDAHLQQRETQQQRLVVLGGDVHVGAAFALTTVSPKPRVFYQLTTSAVTNRVKAFEADAGVIGAQFFEQNKKTADGLLDVRLLGAARDGPARNPIGGLNAGVIDLQRNGPQTNVRLKLLGYGDDLEVKEEYQSAWL